MLIFKGTSTSLIIVKYLAILIPMLILFGSCVRSQESTEHGPGLVGGSCEGCEAVLEYGDRVLTNTDTLPDFHDEGLKIRVTGTIYEADGKTPAEGVILYVYHTNQEGVYEPAPGATGWAKRHGYIRGWVKTGEDGRYTFYTLKPVAYPSRTLPAHIHPTILEPDGKYYWLGSYHFEGDPLVTEDELNPESPRGGSTGLLRLEMKDGIMTGERDFVLGKNVYD